MGLFHVESLIGGLEPGSLGLFVCFLGSAEVGVFGWNRLERCGGGDWLVFGGAFRFVRGCWGFISFTLSARRVCAVLSVVITWRVIG